MFYHNFKYSLKTLFKNKMLIFWTFIFPIILGTFFNLAFSDIESSEKLDIIDIAIVDTEEFKNNDFYTEAFNNLSDKKNKNQLFKITYTSLEKSKELLNDKKVTGYLEYKDNKFNIVVSSSGINETILRYVVDEVNSQKEIINELIDTNVKNEIINNNYNIDYESIYFKVLEMIDNNEVKLNNISNNKLSYTMIEFYTLIAMSALYGGILSMFITNYKLANMNSVGKRTSISSLHKGVMLLSSLFASYIVQLIGLTLLFIYTIFILNVDYGNNFFLVILLAMSGSLAGLTLGVAISSLFKSNENTKMGILIAFIMFCSFLSGMMGITMKYVVDKNVPFINKINPASMITDGFYALYYYDTLDRYWFNIVSLLLFSLVMIVISYRGLRRQKYDSI